MLHQLLIYASAKSREKIMNIQAQITNFKALFLLGRKND